MMIDHIRSAKGNRKDHLFEVFSEELKKYQIAKILRHEALIDVF